MQRFDSWNLSKTADFWSKKFKPNSLINTTGFINSALSQQLDSYLLEKYDINDIDEHTPGTAYIWSRLDLDPPTYDSSSYPYCYVYTIDPNWIYLDAIYDKHVNPSIKLQNKIDYSYTQKSGKLKCKKKIVNEDGAIPRVYISKGWYAEYRIYNEIGHLLNYIDRDSSLYRDSIAPILAALYLGPTYYHLLAILNVMIGLPIAKYDGEVILSIVNGIITTDKYSYVIGTIHTHLKVGAILRKFQPLTDVVELHTNELEPSWWKGHPTTFFSKYTPGTFMTNELRDYIMENYLSDSVAGIEFRQDKLGTNPVKLNTQIQDLFLKAAPTHSDFLFTQSYHVGTSYDVYNLMILNDDTKILPRLRVRSMFGRFTKNIGVDGQFCISSSILPVPVVNDNYVEGKSFKFGNGIWHLYDVYDGFKDFWKFLNRQYTEPKNEVLVEPWSEFVYLRNGETPLFKDSERKFVPYDLPEELKPTVFLEFGTPDKDEPRFGKFAAKGDVGLFSNISLAGELIEGAPTTLSIPTITTYSAQDILNVKFPKQWERHQVTGISKNNYFYLTVQSDASSTTPNLGYVISPEINVGIIPKTLIPSLLGVTIPRGAGVDLAYSLYNKDNNIWEEWVPIESGEKVAGRSISGKIKFKIRLFQNKAILDGNPTVSGFRLNIIME